MAGLGSRVSPAGWTSVRTAVVGDLLAAALAELSAGPLRVVDAGGGTGGFAVPLAAAGHHVTVVDPSPDAMAALRRRAEERGVTGAIEAVQGDLAGLLEVVAPGSADVVLCHNVLEVVDDAATALAAIRAALRPGGLVSVLVVGRGAAVLSRALAGRFAEAATLLAGGQSTPGPRRYDVPTLHTALLAAGLRPERTHGIRVFSDLVPGALLDADPGATEALLALERAASERPEYVALAAQLHVLARRPAD
ncbi:MAG TPA: methyltransferase domain-containing protein [Mycobacteriales bacterium]|jgi:SAM-dependent methyltransferase|nr:methyltransferase domain-containing protein [Mycobacteriales bacterium]